MAPIRLLPEENLINTANPHWIFLFGPLFGLLFFWLILWQGSCQSLEFLSLHTFCHLLASFAVLFAILVVYLDWHFDRLYLTNYRVIKERGIIGKRFSSIWLDKIQDISVEISFWGRILGYGDLIIESAGTFGQVRFEGFADLIKIKSRIEEKIKNY
jgi:uncharacterized membrane protein YdbT with pleckstrin-like domain